MSTTLFSRKLVNGLVRKQLTSLTIGRSVKNTNQRQYHLLNRPSSVSTLNDVLLNVTSLRSFSKTSTSEEETASQQPTDEAAAEEGNAEEGNDDIKSEEPSEVEKLEAQVKELKDQLLRSYAEQENIRRIAKTDVENSRAFAISSFAKSLLETSDNLTRALDAVPEDYRSDKENHPVLATLFEGIEMTDNGLTKAFQKNGLKKFGEVGDKFDPNMHDALFEYPDEKMEAGQIGQVMKVGFSLKDRVIRPAEVGVIKRT